MQEEDGGGGEPIFHVTNANTQSAELQKIQVVSYKLSDEVKKKAPTQIIQLQYFLLIIIIIFV